MALLERVATLVRANLNDLVDKAEDPEKMLKQVILDMENQLLQVKTQVAIAIADQHLLEKKEKENGEKATEWMRRAEAAKPSPHSPRWPVARTPRPWAPSCRSASRSCSPARRRRQRKSPRT